MRSRASPFRHRHRCARRDRPPAKIFLYNIDDLQATV
jgi:hypothetical protein